jgi:hypothetical protein
MEDGEVLCERNGREGMRVETGRFFVQGEGAARRARGSIAHSHLHLTPKQRITQSANELLPETPSTLAKHQRPNN